MFHFNEYSTHYVVIVVYVYCTFIIYCICIIALTLEFRSENKTELCNCISDKSINLYNIWCFKPIIENFNENLFNWNQFHLIFRFLFLEKKNW